MKSNNRHPVAIINYTAANPSSKEDFLDHSLSGIDGNPLPNVDIVELMPHTGDGVWFSSFGPSTCTRRIHRGYDPVQMYFGEA